MEGRIRPYMIAEWNRDHPKPRPRPHRWYQRLALWLWSWTPVTRRRMARELEASDEVFQRRLAHLRKSLHIAARDRD